MFHADGQTDTTKLTVALSKFANASKNQTLIMKLHSEIITDFSDCLALMVKTSQVLRNVENISLVDMK